MTNLWLHSHGNVRMYIYICLFFTYMPLSLSLYFIYKILHFLQFAHGIFALQRYFRMLHYLYIFLLGLFRNKRNTVEDEPTKTWKRNGEREKWHGETVTGDNKRRDDRDICVYKANENLKKVRENTWKDGEFFHLLSSTLPFIALKKTETGEENNNSHLLWIWNLGHIKAYKNHTPTKIYEYFYSIILYHFHIHNIHIYSPNSLKLPEMTWK